MSDMSPIPYYPGREALWVGSGGMARAEVDENELVHPIAIGAEAYYKYAAGDSLTITLSDGKAMIREFKVGDVFWSEAQTHIGENIGDTATHVLMIEMK